MGVLQAAEAGRETDRPPAAPDVNGVITWFAAVVAGIGGAILIFGWGFGLQTIKSIGPWVAGIAPSTAISFVLCGIAVLCAHRLLPHPGRATTIAVLVPTLVVCLIALVNLALLALTPYHGIEEIIFPLYPQLNTVYMAPATASTLIAAAICLVTLVWTNPRGRA